ncbi:hypothetical protein QYZ88_004295 [Lachnospiraceae bacterium C1.1]|nr:hypothetical protein [Lachnospiraceae bacterium C1.1]
MNQRYVKKVVSDGGVTEQKDVLGIVTVIISTLVSLALIILGILVFLV